MKAHWQMFAGYNAWANARIYDSASQLTDEDYRADRGAFFKSVHGTLNHLLVADHIWMRRFTGVGEAPDRLDAILFDSLTELQQARIEEDARILAFVESLDDAELSRMLRYRAISTPIECEQELRAALAHWFNHQTHHRGQIHGLLTRLTGTAPELDLLVYQRLSGLGGTRWIG